MNKKESNDFGWCRTGKGMNDWGFCSFSCSLNFGDENDLMMGKLFSLFDCKRLASQAKDLNVSSEFCFSGIVRSHKTYLYKFV